MEKFTEEDEEEIIISNAVKPIEEAYQKGEISFKEMDLDLSSFIEGADYLERKMIKRKALLNLGSAVGLAGVFPAYYLSGLKELVTNIISGNVYQSAGFIGEVFLKTAIDCAIILPITFVGFKIYEKIANKLNFDKFLYNKAGEVVFKERERIISEKFGSVEEYEKLQEMNEIYGLDKEKE